MKKRIKVLPHDWSAFVDRNLFEQVLVSAAGVPITYLLVSGGDSQPGWLSLNPLLSFLCFGFAFLRVWKSAKEEAETLNAWEILEDNIGRKAQKLDLITEPLFIFTIFLICLYTDFVKHGNQKTFLGFSPKK